MKPPTAYRIKILGLRIWTQVRYSRQLGGLGRNSFLQRPALLLGSSNIHIGANTTIRWGARIEAQPRFEHRRPSLRIGDNTNIEQHVHIMCQSRIEIGSNVSITGHCAIVDISHPHAAGEGKIGDRILDEDSFVIIEDNVFIGYGTVILANVRIGEGAIVGANSVVTRSIPARSVASGSPAVVRGTIGLKE